MASDEQLMDYLKKQSPPPGGELEAPPVDLPVDDAPVFPEAARARRTDIIRRAEEGQFGEEEKMQAGILRTLPKQSEIMAKQGFTPAQIERYRQQSQQFLSRTKKRSVDEEVYGFTQRGEPIKGVMIDLGKNIYEGLTQEWMLSNKGKQLPDDIKRNFRVVSEGISERLKDDPSQAAILRDLYMGFKAVPDALMLGASAVYNIGTITRYALDKADALLGAVSG